MVQIVGPQGNNGWYTGQVTVSLSATDTLSGVSKTSYQVDNGGVLKYYRPFVLGTSGTRLLRFWSLDNAGNVETANQQTIQIDTHPPQITLFAMPPMLLPNRQTVPVVVFGTITGPTSGVDPGSLTYTVTDSYNQLQPSGSFTIDSSGRYSFPLSLDTTIQRHTTKARKYNITVSATSIAGKTRTATTSVTVLPM